MGREAPALGLVTVEAPISDSHDRPSCSAVIEISSIDVRFDCDLWRLGGIYHALQLFR